MKHDKNKKYGYDEMMYTATQIAAKWYDKELYRVANIVLNVVYMALKDCDIPTEKIKEIDKLIYKYISDFKDCDYEIKDLIDYVDKEVIADLIRLSK